jgi:hypothetical protein
MAMRAVFAVEHVEGLVHVLALHDAIAGGVFALFPDKMLVDGLTSACIKKIALNNLLLCPR